MGVSQGFIEKGAFWGHCSTQYKYKYNISIIMPSENFTSMNLITVNLITMINGSL